MSTPQDLAEAVRAVGEGRVADAVRVYKTAIESEPDDIRLQERLGDVLRLDGQNAAAAWTFRAVAGYWEERGFFLRAVVVYKKLLEMESDDTEARGRLATIYKRLQLHKQARAQLLLVAELSRTAGLTERWLDALHNILEIAPSDVQTRIQYAQGLVSNQRKTEAVDALKDGMKYARSKSDQRAFLHLGTRYLKLVPDDNDVSNQVEVLRKSSGRALVVRDATPPSMPHEPAVQIDNRRLASHPFSMSSEALIEAPEHVLSKAIRARRFGDAMEALALLERPEADDFPYAAIYERSLCHVELGNFAEAYQSLEMLSMLPSLTVRDRELVWYNLGIACEGMGRIREARQWFERIDATSGGHVREVAEKLAGYAHLGEY